MFFEKIREFMWWFDYLKKILKSTLFSYFSAFIGFDKDIYCKTCCPKLNHATDSIDSSKIKGDNEAPDTCPKCKGKVFENEKIMTKKFAFHKSCFSCFGCNLTLDIGSVHEDSAGYIFCKNCYVDRNFSGKNSYMARANSASRKNSISTEFSENENQTSACLRCKSKVYEAEKVQVKAGLYHVYCLKCHECQKQLESTSFLEARDR